MKVNKLALLGKVCLTSVVLGTTIISSFPTEAVMFRSSGRPAPRQTYGGASRDGACFAEDNNIEYKSLWPSQEVGLTIAEHPTLFAYIPQTSAQQVLLSIKDEADNLHYRQYLPLKAHGGVVGVKIPQDAPPLQLEKNYRWSLQIVCHQDDPDHPETFGWIRRVPMDANFASGGAKASVEKVSWLAQAGIWCETISTLASLRQAEPENQTLRANWQELLTSVGLEDLATQPLKD